jgi:DNA-binding NarL/FixJ family response regulator
VSAPARILIGDPDVASRAGISLALRGHGFEVCAEADSAEAAVASAVRERPDLCLLEAELPGGAIEAARAIRERVPQAVLVMLGADVDGDRLFAALSAGARGYLPKDMDPARLPVTLHGVLAGEAALPRAAVGRVLDELRALEHGRHARELAGLGVQLTNRERQVLELLDRGLDTGEIADALSISGVTVRRHTSEIIRKLGVPDRDAVLRAIREPPA